MLLFGDNSVATVAVKASVLGLQLRFPCLWWVQQLPGFSSPPGMGLGSLGGWGC